MASSTTPTSRSSASLSSRSEEMIEKPALCSAPSLPNPSNEAADANSSPEFLTWTSSSDPSNPFNFPVRKKWRTTLLACSMTFLVQVSGTMLTSAASQINTSFSISDEAFPHSYWPVLSWNLGGAAAPLMGLPLMENFGVRWSYLAIYAVLIIFIIPQALAENFATLIVTRVITGSCSGVLANITSGIVSDIWRPGRAQSFGTSLYIFALLAGLSMGPVFGSLVVRWTTWRW